MRGTKGAKKPSDPRKKEYIDEERKKKQKARRKARAWGSIEKVHKSEIKYLTKATRSSTCAIYIEREKSSLVGRVAVEWAVECPVRRRSDVPRE